MWPDILKQIASSPDVAASVNPPAGPDAIDALERRVGAALPSSFKAYLATMDGQNHLGNTSWLVDCNESLAAALLPAVVQTLNDEHPDLTLHVTQMSRPITEEARRLRNREVEFIVARGVFAVPEDDLDVELLFEEPLLLIAGAASRWVANPPRGLADLLAAPWVLYPPGEPPGTLVDEAFRAQGLAPPERGVTTSSFYLRQQLLETGDYITVAPRCMIAVFNARQPVVAQLPVDLGISLRPVAIYTLRNRTLSPLAKMTIDAIRATSAGLR